MKLQSILTFLEMWSGIPFFGVNLRIAEVIENVFDRTSSMAHVTLIYGGRTSNLHLLFAEISNCKTPLIQLIREDEQGTEVIPGATVINLSKITMEEAAMEVVRVGILFALKDYDVFSSIHYDIRCDKCRVFPIRGPRYSCTQCEFDLCSKCYSTTIQHPHKRYNRYFHPCTPQEEAAKRSLNGERFRTACHHVGKTDKELSFRKGEEVELLDWDVNTGIGTARLLGNSRGYILLSHLEPITEVTPRKKKRKKSRFNS